MSAIQQMLMVGGGPAIGQQEYKTNGVFSWVCPAGVTSVCVVVITPGGAGTGTAGGAGGALAYINNHSVIPGTSYTVARPAPASSSTEWYFASNLVVCATTAFGVNPGTFLKGTGGGSGGNPGYGGSSYITSDGYTVNCGGGGGSCGGYSGSGGYGGEGPSASQGPNSSRGIGSLGSAGTRGGNSAYTGYMFNTGADGSDAGGYATPYGTVVESGNQGSSAFTPGISASANHYGSGAGGASIFNGSQGGIGSGGPGIIRIIWGEGRAFPSTNVGDI